MNYNRNSRKNLRRFIPTAEAGGNAAVLCSVLDINLNHYNKFRQDNTCVNVLEYKDGEWKLLLMNSVEHLGYLYKGMNK